MEMDEKRLTDLLTGVTLKLQVLTSEISQLKTQAAMSQTPSTGSCNHKEVLDKLDAIDLGLQGMAQEPSHVAGLCGQEDCEGCQQSTQDVIAFAQETARESERAAVIADIERSLERAGGVPLRQRFTDLIQAGQQLESAAAGKG